MAYDIMRVMPWAPVSIRVTLHMRGSSELTIESKSGKRVSILLTQEQTDKFREDMENATLS